jgi:hypothetical protein
VGRRYAFEVRADGLLQNGWVGASGFIGLHRARCRVGGRPKLNVAPIAGTPSLAGAGCPLWEGVARRELMIDHHYSNGSPLL